MADGMVCFKKLVVLVAVLANFELVWCEISVASWQCSVRRSGSRTTQALYSRIYYIRDSVQSQVRVCSIYKCIYNLTSCKLILQKKKTPSLAVPSTASNNMFDNIVLRMAKGGLRYVRLLKFLFLLFREFNINSTCLLLLNKRPRVRKKNEYIYEKTIPRRSYKFSREVVPTMGAVTPFQVEFI